MRIPLIIVVGALFLGGCGSGGVSTQEMRAAAVEHARNELGLAADVPLEAKVWVGTEEHDGETVLCGTVSDRTTGSRMSPQRFAATGDPINWLVFEDAHDPLVTTQPDKFPEWQRLCGGNAQGG